MATHSSILAWRIPWTVEPGGLQSMGHKELDATEQVGTRAHALRESWQAGEESLLWASLASMLWGVYKRRDGGGVHSSASVDVCFTFSPHPVHSCSSSDVNFIVPPLGHPYLPLCFCLLLLPVELADCIIPSQSCSPSSCSHFFSFRVSESAHEYGVCILTYGNHYIH